MKNNEIILLAGALYFGNKNLNNKGQINFRQSSIDEKGISDTINNFLKKEINNAGLTSLTQTQIDSALPKLDTSDIQQEIESSVGPISYSIQVNLVNIPTVTLEEKSLVFDKLNNINLYVSIDEPETSNLKIQTTFTCTISELVLNGHISGKGKLKMLPEVKAESDIVFKINNMILTIVTNLYYKNSNFSITNFETTIDKEKIISNIKFESGLGTFAETICKIEQGAEKVIEAVKDTAVDAVDAVENVADKVGDSLGLRGSGECINDITEKTREQLVEMGIKKVEPLINKQLKKVLNEQILNNIDLQTIEGLF
jgi:hypothetical protein